MPRALLVKMLMFIALFFAAAVNSNALTPIPTLYPQGKAPSNSMLQNVVLKGTDLSKDPLGNAKGFVALVEADDSRSSATVSCVGVAVAPDVVVTAGHCLADIKNLRVRFVSNLSPLDFETIPARSYRFHPMTNAGNTGKMYHEFTEDTSYKYHDIGVILLESPSNFVVPATIVPLGFAAEKVTDPQFFVFGRGRDFQTRAYTGNIELVRILNPEPMRSGSNYYKAVLDLAGDLPQAICVADSGGPVTVSARDEHVEGRRVHLLAGIFTMQVRPIKLANPTAALKEWGSKDRIPTCGMGMGYVNILAELDWIEQTLAEMDVRNPRRLHVQGRDGEPEKADDPSKNTESSDAPADRDATDDEYDEQHTVTITPVAPEFRDPKYKKYTSFDLTGTTFQSEPTSSLEECETSCSVYEGCKAYTFDSWNRVCHLKEEIGELKLNAKARSGVNMAFALPPRSQSEMKYKFYNEKAFPGKGYARKRAKTRYKCEAACANDAACIAFTFAKAKQQCDLFEVADEYASKAGYQSGAKVQE